MSEALKYTKKELVEKYFPIYWYRKHLDIAARDILGLNLAPHHALIIRDWSTQKPIGHLLSSRAMGKTVLMAIYFLLCMILYPKLKIVVAAGNAFRGSKQLLLEVERIMQNFLDGQGDSQYARACLMDPRKLISKDPSWWTITMSNGSIMYGIPLAVASSGGPVRGLRAHYLGTDEAFLIPTKLMQAVLSPMQNVVYDMNRPTEEQLINNMQISVSTIDYTFRDFWKVGEYYKSVLEKGQKKIHGGITVVPDDISYFEFNMCDSYYTVNGKRVQVWGIDYDRIMKKKELPTTDEAIWEAENKNIPLDVSGGYFSFEAIEAGMHTLLKKTPAEVTPQILDSCSGQCILGVDTAPSGDNTAFVVIKAGVLNSTDKDVEVCKVANMGEPCPFLEGKRCVSKRFVPVIYAYQQNKMSQQERIELIYELMSRYNIIGIAMDRRGGGTELADLLKDKDYVFQKVGENALPIYDPKYDLVVTGGLPILKMYSTTQEDNLVFNGFMKGLINNRQLLFPLPLRGRPDNQRILQIAGHMESLVNQVVRIKAVPRGKSISFEIETVDPQTGRTVSGRKDLYSALLYAIARLRELVDLNMEEEEINLELARPVAFTF